MDEQTPQTSWQTAIFRIMPQRRKNDRLRSGPNQR
jgi:hypothetical protein